MIRCIRCLLPETHETIVIDAAGVCNICSARDFRDAEIDWEQRAGELAALVEEYRGKHDYDCLIPYSGGKDSTWTLYYLVKNFGIKPLVVRFNHGFMRPVLQQNADRVMRALGVDFHDFTPNWHTVRQLMLRSLIDKGDFCWHCHTGIFSYPMHVAIEKRVPLIFWGEPSAEYTAYFSYEEAEEVNEDRFNRFVNLGITADDMFVRLGGSVDPRDLKPYTYPPLASLQEVGYRSVCLGSYIPWDPKRQSSILESDLGWSGDQVENVPPGYRYEKIECSMQGVRDYLKFIKRGYSRPTHLAALDLRAGRISLEDARSMVEQYEGRRPPSLDVFLELLSMTEDEFNAVAISHAVSPYVHDPSSTQPGERTHDYPQWNRAGAMPRDLSHMILRQSGFSS
jgi:N-acetyl sugar amidotransferase